MGAPSINDFRELLSQDQRGVQQREEQPGPLPHGARHVYRPDMRLSVHEERRRSG